VSDSAIVPSAGSRPADRPGASAPALPLWKLVQTAHLAERRFTEVFAAAGLTPAQFGVLACLADGDDLSKADLAKAILVRPQSMARLTDAMVAQGLLQRAGPRTRGRRSTLTMTERGRRALEQARPAAWAINQPAAIGLDQKEVDVLLTQLHTISRTLADPADRA
jgi:DNA-binding MarR family transcriptional regulator